MPDSTCPPLCTDTSEHYWPLTDRNGNAVRLHFREFGPGPTRRGDDRASCALVVEETISSDGFHRGEPIAQVFLPDDGRLSIRELAALRDRLTAALEYLAGQK